ncbi:hypothetical protein FRACYDRAFT_246275 [Fragilariopsis cylindrus CCMP1102]|uniref:Uncharacterized protein n=1 Tax=Fragilariopsis cylindrus CCMP1102 TaxID=635003 RepID=A0A1E7F022_9STRA|nr:hypothetical protein FRACYDRAFT_246275 [Fragilariopsis cylindrus CCMP1102]|eukprot:OEU11163.1 hypothetical protein FRACYDRAFT_246275 [Fragilariopsis cylindrus CCMP1102]
MRISPLTGSSAKLQTFGDRTILNPYLRSPLVIALFTDCTISIDPVDELTILLKSRLFNASQDSLQIASSLGNNAQIQTGDYKHYYKHYYKTLAYAYASRSGRTPYNKGKLTASRPMSPIMVDIMVPVEAVVNDTVLVVEVPASIADGFIKGMTPLECQKLGHMSESTLLPQEVLSIQGKGSSTKDTEISE